VAPIIPSLMALDKGLFLLPELPDDTSPLRRLLTHERVAHGESRHLTCNRFLPALLGETLAGTDLGKVTLPPPGETSLPLGFLLPMALGLLNGGGLDNAPDGGGTLSVEPGPGLVLEEEVELEIIRAVEVLDDGDGGTIILPVAVPVDAGVAAGALDKAIRELLKLRDGIVAFLHTEIRVSRENKEALRHCPHGTPRHRGNVRREKRGPGPRRNRCPSSRG
jgi:hypothetical protein